MSGGTLVQRFEAARAAGDPQALLEALPYARFIGARAELAGGTLRLLLPFQRKLVGNPFLPALHGGVLGGLIELAATATLLWHQDSLRLPKSVTTTVDYARSGQPRDTQAAAEVTRVGRRMATVAVRLWQESQERPIATGQAHFLLS